MDADVRHDVPIVLNSDFDTRCPVVDGNLDYYAAGFCTTTV